MTYQYDDREKSAQARSMRHRRMNTNICNECNGTGMDAPHTDRWCDACAGTGHATLTTHPTTMKATHTPGPWTSEVPPSSCLTTRHIIGPNREPVAAVGLPEGYACGTFTDVANARLIAAAPELLCMLSRVLDEYLVRDPANGPICPLTLEQARNAITKATTP